MLKNITGKVLLPICLGISSFFCIAPVRAAVIKYDFTLNFSSSNYSSLPLSGVTANGYFTYDDSSILTTTRRYSYAPIVELLLNLPNNISLTKQDDVNQNPTARFYNGNFVGIDYVVSKPSLTILISQNLANQNFVLGSSDPWVSARRYLDFSSPYYLGSDINNGNFGIIYGSIAYTLSVPTDPHTTQIPEPLTTGGTIVAGMLGFALARKSKVKSINLG